jgi:hypothetical protein
MAKRKTNARRLTKGKPKQYKRETNAERAAREDERRWIIEGIPVLISEDQDSEHPKTETLAALEGAARRDIEQLAKQIHRCCSDKKWNSYQKRVACEQLVNLAFLSTDSMYHLAKEFPEPFREIAEVMSRFPCIFPAHVDEVKQLQKVLWDDFNLGRRHTLKLRGKPGRKTFSLNTWVNALLLSYFDSIHRVAARMNDLGLQDRAWRVRPSSSA